MWLLCAKVASTRTTQELKVSQETAALQQDGQSQWFYGVTDEPRVEEKVLK